MNSSLTQYKPIKSDFAEIKTVDDIVSIRRAAREFAAKMGFGLADQTRLATAVSELARNVIQYAGEGYSHIHDFSNAERRILIVEVIDSGAGIENIQTALQEGYSTGSGLGIGLSSCKRLMDVFSIVSYVNKGTRVKVELHASR